jgi:hypothetical protein
MEAYMTNPQSRSKTKRWTGEATDLDRYFAAHDPRQMHFFFYTEEERSEVEFRDGTIPPCAMSPFSEPLVAAA